jgi:hypothetical protein
MSAVEKWLSGGEQENNYIFRKGLGALTKKNPVPHLQFCYFDLKTENNFQKHKFCCRSSFSAVLANEMRRRASNYHDNRT